MAFTTYRYVLTDYAGNARGELAGATGRSLQRTHNGIDTASVTVSLTDPVARYLLAPDEEHLLKIYRQEDGQTPQLLFHGPVVDVETVFGATDGSAQINAASPVWWMTHRLAYKRSLTVNGKQYPIKHTISNTKRSQIALAAIQEADAEYPLKLSLPASAPDSGVISIDDAGWRPLAELLIEMSCGQIGGLLEGFDFWVDPTEYAADKIGALRMGPRGQARPGVIFETGIGTRNNAVQARQPVTRGSLANHVYHYIESYPPPAGETPAEWAEEKVELVSQPQTAYLVQRGRHEALLSDDIPDATYRKQLVDLHAAVRERPRRIITFNPAPEEQGEGVPRAAVDYDVGDRIQLRVVAPNGAIAINDELRVYGISTEIDDQAGTGQHTLTLVPEE